MAIVIRAHHRSAFGGLLNEAFRLRRRIFMETLGWKLPDLAGDGEREIDQFDFTPAVHHLVAVNDAGQVVGTCRLTPSDAPNVTCDVLQAQIGAPLPRSSKIVESSRFCVDLSLSREERTAIMGDLYISHGELAEDMGWTQTMGVYYQSSLEALIRQGFAVDALGAPIRFAPGDPFSYPYLMTASTDGLERMMAAFGAPQGKLQDPEKDSRLLRRFREAPVRTPQLMEAR
ncbi:acyl-homoserine-lactone synthase [Caulobacter sp. NIBR2454]|uniref:acyl-homoserine-lactone synthase n=1 Tax=Caulobacter sp. NIBR2454 TaxID=3015996 RepID=UPI0022B742EA|nr:acyl-homoserine-lactone synthase [Caulobacter sp. NIBR2454]